MIKINMMRPKCEFPLHYNLWFKYDEPRTMINQIAEDIALITPRERGAGFCTEQPCLPQVHGQMFVKLHGEIYSV